MGLIDRLMTALWGPLCADGCEKRVYPKDAEWHRNEWCTAQMNRK